MKLLTIACTLAATVSAAAVPRGIVLPPNMCCFNLQDASTGSPVQEDFQSGVLFLNSPHESDIFFCLDPNDQRNILWDQVFGACIIDYWNRFQCLDGTPGDDVWGMQRDGDRHLVVHNGDTHFNACPASEGGQQIDGLGQVDGSQCRGGVQLLATNLRGPCDKY